MGTSLLCRQSRPGRVSCEARLIRWILWEIDGACVPTRSILRHDWLRQNNSRNYLPLAAFCGKVRRIGCRIIETLAGRFMDVGHLILCMVRILNNNRRRC